MSTFTPFLMFTGQAEEAMNFYTTLFPNSKINSITHYKAGEAGAGTVMQASFSLGDQHFMCIDSPVKHDFNFTPAISVFVVCDTEAEVDKAFNALADGGAVLMPLGAYPFSKKFGWVNDKFGVSWQLSVALN